jgi:hypothetical protein
MGDGARRDTTRCDAATTGMKVWFKRMGETADVAAVDV